MGNRQKADALMAAIASADDDVLQEAMFRLPADQKLRLLDGMAFTRERLEHGPGCLSRQGGFRCTCTPPASRWRAPTDVRKHLGESHDARTAFGAERALYEDDGIGKFPGSWAL